MPEEADSWEYQAGHGGPELWDLEIRNRLLRSCWSRCPPACTSARVHPQMSVDHPHAVGLLKALPSPTRIAPCEDEPGSVQGTVGTFFRATSNPSLLEGSTPPGGPVHTRRPTESAIHDADEENAGKGGLRHRPRDRRCRVEDARRDDETGAGWQEVGGDRSKGRPGYPLHQLQVARGW